MGEGFYGRCCREDACLSADGEDVGLREDEDKNYI
jgi:hypothetical protein